MSLAFLQERKLPYVVLAIEAGGLGTFKAVRVSTGDRGIVLAQNVSDEAKERVRDNGRARVTIPARDFVKMEGK